MRTSLDDGVAESALRVALALSRARSGAILLRRGDRLEFLASNLDADAEGRVRALLNGVGRGGPERPAEGGCLLSFGEDGRPTVAVYLEEARETLGARRVGELLSRRFAGEDTPSDGAGQTP